MAIDFLGRKTVFLVVIVVSVVLTTIAIMYVDQKTRRYISPEDAAERQDLRYVLLCISLLDDSSLEDLVKPGENVNSTTFATLCTNRLQEYQPPLASFSIGSDGIIDSNGNLIYVMRFLDDYDYEEIKVNRLGRDYSFAAWTVGPNGINEYGGGDDHFIGKRRDGEIDVRFSKRN